MSPSTLLTITHTITASSSPTTTPLTAEVLSTAKQANIPKLIGIAVIVVAILIGVSLLGLLLLAKRSSIKRTCSGGNTTNITYVGDISHEMGEIKEPTVMTAVSAQESHSVERGATEESNNSMVMQSEGERVLKSEDRVMRGDMLVTIRVERLVGEEVGGGRRVEDVMRKMEAEEGFVHRLSPEKIREARDVKRKRFCARMVRGMYLEAEEERM